MACGLAAQLFIVVEIVVWRLLRGFRGSWNSASQLWALGHVRQRLVPLVQLFFVLFLIKFCSVYFNCVTAATIFFLHCNHLLWLQGTTHACLVVVVVVVVVKVAFCFAESLVFDRETKKNVTRSRLGFFNLVFAFVNRTIALRIGYYSTN